MEASSTNAAQAAIQHPPNELMRELEVVRRGGGLAQDAGGDAGFQVEQQPLAGVGESGSQHLEAEADPQHGGRGEGLELVWIERIKLEAKRCHDSFRNVAG